MCQLFKVGRHLDGIRLDANFHLARHVGGNGQVMRHALHLVNDGT